MGSSSEKNRKPLILKGARQVGKTWLMKEFGRKYFKYTAYINFDNNKRMEEVFSMDYDIERILMAINIETGVKIIPGETLIIFDEVQENKRVIASLKYFYEDAPEYTVVAAGSLLGVAIHEGVSFPVGKVDTLELNPLSFNEFLLALGENGLVSLNYYTETKSEGKIDFLIQKDSMIVPIEVKAEENLRAKSLRCFCEKYSPELAIRTSMSKYREQDWMINLPLYAISCLEKKI